MKIPSKLGSTVVWGLLGVIFAVLLFSEYVDARRFAAHEAFSERMRVRQGFKSAGREGWTDTIPEPPENKRAFPGMSSPSSVPGLSQGMVGGLTNVGY